MKCYTITVLLKGKELATKINDVLFKVLDIRDRGVKSISKRDRGANLLRKTKAPTVIVESCFFSNNLDTQNFLLKFDELVVELANLFDNLEVL